MSTQNNCFHGEIRKIFKWMPLLFRANVIVTFNVCPEVHISADDNLRLFFLFFQENTGFAIPCKLSPVFKLYFLKRVRKHFKMLSAEIFTSSAKH